MKDAHISMERLTQYLQQINDDKEFTKQNIEVPVYQPKEKTKANLFSKKRQKKVVIEDKKDEKESNNDKKMHNKNRAIKRIIETSRQILQSNYNYKVQPEVEQKKSYVTQFNIYLKQYNRLSQNIHRQQKTKTDRINQTTQSQENQLQNVYIYTVHSDLRQVLKVAVLKDRISKTNIQMMIDSFEQSLVILKNSEIHLHDGVQESSNFRTLKIFQISNVDYHTQPYIFMVVTITKDKSKGQQYLYMMFNSVENQIKWDRALYCNFMHKRMKRKQKLFLLEYPQIEQDNKRKLDQRQHLLKKQKNKYEIDKDKCVKKILGKLQTKSASKGLETEKNLFFDFINPKIQRLGTDEDQKKTSQNSKMVGSTKNAETNNFFKKNSLTKPKEEVKFQEPQKSPVIFQKKNTSFFQKKQTQILLENKQENNEPEEKKTDRLQIQKVESQHQSNEKSYHTGNLDTKRKIELRKKYESGQQITKSKFFFDKKKLFYFLAEGIQYWDYNQKTKEKSERKLIKFGDIQAWSIKKEQKIILVKYNKTKQIQLQGSVQTLEDISEWIQIHKKDQQQQIN